MQVPTGAARFVDVLVVDDMENVAKKLRVMLPAHINGRGEAFQINDHDPEYHRAAARP